MIKVVEINKEKNRVKSYTCIDLDDDRQFDLSKDELIDLIHNKQVTNATAYKFQGATSVRLVDKKKTEERKKIITLYKLVHEAKKRGILNLDLSDLMVNTETMVVSRKSTNEALLDSSEE